MADETTTPEQTETKPKRRAPRKPADPIAAFLDEVRKELANVGDVKLDDSRQRRHDNRAAAWATEYAKTGAHDALILSLAFELLSCFPQERRHSAVQLAAAALKVAEAGK